eukprot:1022608-Prymnesium_polylepis.1
MLAIFVGDDSWHAGMIRVGPTDGCVCVNGLRGRGTRTVCAPEAAIGQFAESLEPRSVCGVSFSRFHLVTISRFGLVT